MIRQHALRRFSDPAILQPVRYAPALVVLVVSAVAVFPQTRREHLSGEVFHGQEFRRELSSGLIFRLRPTDAGWTIEVVPKARCAEVDEDWACVVNPPFRYYNSRYLDVSYDTTAAEAVAMSPREVFFVTTCEDYKSESRRVETVLWPGSHTKTEVDEALAKLGTSRLGRVSLTIVESKVSRAEHDINGKNYGKIDWLKFNVDIDASSGKSRPR